MLALHRLAGADLFRFAHVHSRGEEETFQQNVATCPGRPGRLANPQVAAAASWGAPGFLSSPARWLSRAAGPGLSSPDQAGYRPRYPAPRPDSRPATGYRGRKARTPAA